MVIASALRPGPIQLVLAWTPMVWLGRISYSLYLWHYPVFDWVQGGAPGSVAVGAQLWSAVLSVLVAWLSYALVEQKILRGAFTRWPVRRQWLAYVLAASAILVLVLPPAGLRQTKTDLSWPAVDQLPTSLLVMGDSTGYEADRFFPRDVYPAMIVGGTHYIGCGLSDLPYRLSTGDKDVKKCQEWPQLTSEYHERWTPGAAAIFSVVWDSFDRVVEGESYPPGTREFDDDFTRNLAEAVQAAGRDGRYPVYVVKATCLDAQFEETVLNDSNRRNTINRLVDAVVASLPNAQAVDTSWLTCRDGRPAEEMGDSWVRRDGVHWSEEGLRRLWQYILTDISQRQ
jgi:hypothetical protein